MEVVPQTPEETAEVGRLVLHERVQQRTVGETVEVVSLAPHERVQQRSAEKREVVPQTPEETVEVGRLVLHDRVQQRTAKQIEDAPQSPAEAVEAVTLQLLHSLRNMGRERAVRSFEKLREKRALPAVLEEGFAALIQRFPFEKYRRISNVHRFFQANTGVNHVRLKSHAKQKTMEIENCQIRGLASQDSPY